MAACSDGGSAKTDDGTTTSISLATTPSPETSVVSTSVASSTIPPTTASTVPPPVTFPLPDGLRWCGYIPGAVTASEHADAVAVPAPAEALPANTTVAIETTAAQLSALEQVSAAVADNYVDPQFNGKDWPGIVERYRQVVSAGLTDDDFYVAMDGMINELGDGHSNLQSPAEVAAAAELAGRVDFVGIGGFFQPIPEAGGASLILVFHDSPAERAGLRAHDTVVAVDGKSPLGEPGKTWQNPFLGPEGSAISITVSRPSQATEMLDLNRARVEGAKPLDVCLVPGTRIAYVLLPGLFDNTLSDQMASALSALGDSGPLDGVVIDNRMNGGGSSSVLEPILSLFTQGEVGQFRSRNANRPFIIEPNDVNGSQSVPLVIVVGGHTVSYGEVMSGILQASGRARVIGETTNGNVEALNKFDLDDGAQLWLATEAFDPTGATYGPWEETGIVPDLEVPTRWDLFDETNDPALAAAVELLAPV